MATRTSKKAGLSQILSVLRLPYSERSLCLLYCRKGAARRPCPSPCSTIKIDRKTGPLYLIDCGLDPNLYTLLNKDWKAEIVRY